MHFLNFDNKDGTPKLTHLNPLSIVEGQVLITPSGVDDVFMNCLLQQPAPGQIHWLCIHVKHSAGDELQWLAVIS